MVKLRNAYYCNLKVLLIWLVVFGHAIEPYIRSDPMLHQIYRVIYLFHMPLFAFVSGLFMQNPGGCLRQLKRLAPLYCICQFIAMLLYRIPWHTPWWILWYLLSLCFWLALATVLMQWKRVRRTVLFLSVILGCLAGRMPSVGRWMSLSRTVVFFPWFWLGILLEQDIPWHRLRLPSLAVLFLPIPRVDVSLLWQAGPCPPGTRLLCYGYAALWGLLILSWCPRRRLPWTRAGADTLPAYLLHGPLVKLLGPVAHPWLFASIFLYLTCKATRWHSAIGIIGKEECPWPDLKTCTKPRESRSTGFSWP